MPRVPSFVEMSVSDDHRTEEIARTEEQLAQLMVARLAVLRDGIDDEVHAFAALLHVDNLRDIDAFTDEFGDDLSAFAALPAFAIQTPLVAAREGYSGEFPSGVLAAGQCAFFEFGNNPPAAIALPEWLDRKSDKPKAFSRFMAQSRYEKAWLTVNGTWWTFADAADAIRDLSGVESAELQLISLAEIWSRYASEDRGSY